MTSPVIASRYADPTGGANVPSCCPPPRTGPFDLSAEAAETQGVIAVGADDIAGMTSAIMNV